MSANRFDVYRALDSERDYQENLWRGNHLEIGESILLIEEYVARARVIWAGEPKPEAESLEFIRKIGGIAVNCMEQHGAPQREGFER